MYNIIEAIESKLLEQKTDIIVRNSRIETLEKELEAANEIIKSLEAQLAAEKIMKGC